MQAHPTLEPVQLPANEFRSGFPEACNRPVEQNRKERIDVLWAAQLLESERIPEADFSD